MKQPAEIKSKSISMRTIACAISGGVDSAVSALLLKNKGYNVVGVFMKNWDSRDELGYCIAEREKADAMFVCNHLRIPFHDVDFVKDYWNHIFTYLLSEYKNGFTPNPDVLCNKFIKFDALLRHIKERLGISLLATGHYVQTECCPQTKDIKLMQGIDKLKDQTLFLSQISQNALRHCIFPVGALLKRDVKQLALDAGMSQIARKKESMGICFIGKRDFKDFIKKYIEPRHGHFMDIESMKIVGTHCGIHNYTIGQRSLIGGKDVAYFVAEMDFVTQNIYVAKGTHHPSLYSDTFTIEEPHWICSPPPSFAANGSFTSQFRFQHTDPLINSQAKRRDANHRLLDVKLSQPLRALSRGQFAVFYQGHQCLGSARLLEVANPFYHINNFNSLHKIEEIV